MEGSKLRTAEIVFSITPPEYTGLSTSLLWQFPRILVACMPVIKLLKLSPLSSFLTYPLGFGEVCCFVFRNSHLPRYKIFAPFSPFNMQLRLCSFLLYLLAYMSEASPVPTGATLLALSRNTIDVSEGFRAARRWH
jgi:hypothetical protein